MELITMMKSMYMIYQQFYHKVLPFLLLFMSPRKKLITYINPMYYGFLLLGKGFLI